MQHNTTACDRRGLGPKLYVSITAISNIIDLTSPLLGWVASLWRTCRLRSNAHMLGLNVSCLRLRPSLLRHALRNREAGIIAIVIVCVFALGIEAPRKQATRTREVECVLNNRWSVFALRFPRSYGITNSHQHSVDGRDYGTIAC